MANSPSLPQRKVADVNSNTATGQTLPGANVNTITRKAVGGSDAQLGFGGVNPSEAAGRPSGVTAENLPLSPSQS